MNYTPRSTLLYTDMIRKDSAPTKTRVPWLLVAAADGAALIWVFVLLKKRRRR